MYYGVVLRTNQNAQSQVAANGGVGLHLFREPPARVLLHADTNRSVEENIHVKTEVSRTLEDMQRCRIPGIVLPPCFYLKGADLKYTGNQLGGGSHGASELATYRGIQVVVKKMINADRLEEKELRAAVQKEAHVRCQLRPHKSLPLLLGLCLDENPPFIVSRFYSGPNFMSITISNAVRDKTLRESIPWLVILADGADALGAIHDSGIIHCNLKDDNIVLHFNLGTWSPVIIGYGKAVTKGTDIRGQMTNEEAAIWRRRNKWIAPELAFDRAVPDERSDVYSFGLVARRVKKKTRITEKLQEIVEMCLDSNPGKRPSTKYICETLRS